ncbi:hypothetical protein D3C71_1497870 [compost metagenome]
MQLGAVDGALIGFDCAFGLLHQRQLSVQILPRHQIGFGQLLITCQIAPGIGEGGLIFGQLSLRLSQLYLERTRVNFNQQIAGFDLLPFGEVDRHQLAIDPAGDGHGVGGGSRAQPGKVTRHRLLCGGRSLYR